MSEPLSRVPGVAWERGGLLYAGGTWYGYESCEYLCSEWGREL